MATRRLRRRALLALALAMGALALLVGLLGSGTSSRADAQSSASESVQTDASMPARDAIMIGSEANSNETFAIGETRNSSQPWVLVHYIEEPGNEHNGWSLGPELQDSAGQTLSGFEPARSGAGESNLTGEMTPNGSGVLIGAVVADSQERRVLLVRNPGGDFKETLPVPSEGAEPMLKTGEQLYDGNRAPMIAALEEGSNTAGALVVPVEEKGSAPQDRVLHWNGEQWTSEPIEVPEAIEQESFRVLAIGASSTANAWLLAQVSSSGEVALFRRRLGQGSEPTSWLPVAPTPGAAVGAPLAVPTTKAGTVEPFTVPGTGSIPTVKAQVLTVTSQGVWIDGERADDDSLVTMFFKYEGEEPEGKGYRGQLLASWCPARESVEASCTHELPESLPSGPSRSFAWANSATSYGERIITGLIEGVSLRLQGESFERVPALGGGAESFEDPGTTNGAAFSSADEGWLGEEFLPVHLTTSPARDHLSPYPVPFGHVLTAIAPEPGAPVGSLSSEALAVGNDGEVARYKPGEGWQPESLFGAGGRIDQTPLRAVAWPTPTRAYAVGSLDEGGEPQMWLWRGETGLWEPDPAAPANFLGNLLGIAFDPENPSIGYAVGQQGALLRYGKTWTQESLPAEVAGASFTSIAFAGSEALVAYRELVHTAEGTEVYEGGVLVNGGSGWSVDRGAAEALHGEVPWAVAGLPDGGAAISAGGEGAPALVLERNHAGEGWSPTTAPYPNEEAPGSMVLFREGEALRVIGSGGVPDTRKVDTVLPPPVGFPPSLIKPYPLGAGYVLRQTAAGWSDEEHDRDEVQPPPGDYARYDMEFEPDPTLAVLVNPSGSEGWGLGGVSDPEQPSGETADVERYQGDASEAVPSPPGFGTSPVQVSIGGEKPKPASKLAEEQPTFAIGGNAQCEAPCADRANARVGPDVWLSSALQRAGQIGGVRAFLYTGPRVTTGKTNGPPVRTVPYQREYERYATLLRSSPIPVYAAPSATDRDGANNSECLFLEAFDGFPEPFGTGGAYPEIMSAGRSVEACGAGAQSSYYAFNSDQNGERVRVIVLDDSTEVGSTQREWIAGELASAKNEGAPAIAVGNGDLGEEIAAHTPGAEALAQLLVEDGASAYFYDSPEQNVKLTVNTPRGALLTFGSGTLGYVSTVASEREDFDGHSGFLLAQVDAAARNPETNVAPVTAQLIPDIGELALEAKGGVLLRRSSAVFFAALARRPRAGGVATGNKREGLSESTTYVPIPANCIGSNCENAILPEYTFSSSKPEIGEFVEQNLASSIASEAVPVLEHEEPVPDAKSDLFCAYNAGTTVVTISAGGLSASLTVTVQPGSVRRPCGTKPLSVIPPSAQQAIPAPVAPTPAPAPVQSTPTAAASVPLPLPPVLAPPARVPSPRKPLTPPQFFVAPALAAPPLAFVPPPVPTPARPTPPTGTSAVTSPIEVAEREEEQEEATESVRNAAAAYHAPEHEPSPAYLLGLVLLAAFAGASIRRRPRAGKRDVRVAPATISTMRSQRRHGQ
jgi:hypothetical protein